MAALPQGFGVLVTRPAQQAETLCRLVEAGGGTAIGLALQDIATLPADSDGPRLLTQPAGWDWLVFVSANAVRCAFELLGPQWLQSHPAKIAAIGQATAQALAERGVAVDLKPKQQFNSESLLAEPAFADVSGLRFLLVRGVGGREFLAETLRQRGATVEYAEVYRRVATAIDAPALQARWRAGHINAVTLANGEALERLSELMAGDALSLLRQTPMAVVGERLAGLARARGCAQVVVAEASDQGLFDAVACIGQAFIKSHQPRG
ncbi:MAG: uroporphyrinogen-III synthase [Candidatus Methylumidiphilus sp.]